MKRHIWIAGVLLAMCASCDDFLDYNENSDYDQNSVFNITWSNEDFVTGIYAYMPGALSDVDNALRSSGCDEAEFSVPTSGIHRFYDGSWSALNPVDDKWSYYYAGIRRCNDYLENGTGKTWDQFLYDKNYEKIMRKYRNLEWEVKGLRAYLYFELVKRYNRIPLVTKVLTEAEANAQKPVDYQTVVDFIVKECEDISTDGKLPVTYDGNYDNETGRLNRAFALALKARALLYAASPLNNPTNETGKWVKAAEAAKALIDQADGWGIRLVGFNELLATDNFKKAEMILIKRLGDSNTFESINFPVGLDGGNGGNCPTQNLVDAFGMKSGQTLDSAHPYANRDPRLGYTVLCQGAATAYKETLDVTYGGANGLPLEKATRTGYYLSKFVNTSVSLTAVSTTTARHSIPLFRYAEVLLNYAEAMNEAYGPVATGESTLTLNALDALNLVRARGGLDIDLLAAADVPDRTAFRLALRKERMVELAFEDHRFWDIRRWKIGAETATIKRVTVKRDGDGYSYVYSATTNRIWEEKMNFYPIPQAELDKNPNLVQNEGWELK